MHKSNKLIGKRFKELRLNHNYSLQKASKDITSISSLSRWENGNGEMDIEKVFLLLHRIGAQYNELFSLKFDPFLSYLAKAYNQNDSNELSKLTKKALVSLHTSPFSDLALLRAASACNLYYDLLGKNLFSESNVDKVRYRLSDISHWTQYKVNLLGNSILLLPPKAVYSLSILLINDFTFIKDSGPLGSYNALLTLLNSLLALIENDLQLAQKFLQRFDTIPLLESELFIQVEKEFLRSLLYCCEKHDFSSLQIFYVFLDKINMSSLTEKLRFTENKFRKIYL